MKFYPGYFFTCLVYCLVSFSSSAQNRDSIPDKKIFKNTVRLNITAPLIFTTRYMVFGYERMINKNQSFSLNLGVFGLPDFISASDSLNVSGARDKGAHVSIDYRFYLAKENRCHAPHGVYIGPYYSFNHLLRKNTWMFDAHNFNGDVNTSLEVNIHTAGLELGYQFVFWKRLAVDFVAVGPGIGHYSFKTNIDANLKPEKRNELLSAIANRIKEKIPGANSFFDDKQFSKNAGFASWAIGYRYIVHVGYRF